METLTLKQLTSVLKDDTLARINYPHINRRKLIGTTLFVVSDILLLILSMFGALYIREFAVASDPTVIIDTLTMAMSILPVFIITFGLRGLYPGYGLDAVSELRTLTISTTIIYSLIAIASFFIKDMTEFSRLSFGISWIFSLLALPLGRSLIRNICSSKKWWGIPVVIIGGGNTGEQIIKSLKKHKNFGLIPYVVVDDDLDKWGYIAGVPVVGNLNIIPELTGKLLLDYAILAMPKVSATRQQNILQSYSKFFAHTNVIPELFGLANTWVEPKDFGGIVGLEIQQTLLKKSNLFIKRAFDITLASFLLVALMPLIAVIALAIKIDSKGKVFFKQERMGYNDSRFKIIKFRTMHTDAELRLQELLDSNPKYKEEYEIYHKLTDDPRMTKVGKFLRKFSLDEIPQFLNVILGDMSLIGPRAYLPWEKIKMNNYDELILQVKPGISGLWQVTDRNNSSFEERNITDIQYIRTWSIFLDFYILARTIWVIATGDSK
jgi:Undecaprenyl-phosphate galactose phosphotransferase WbaP